MTWLWYTTRGTAYVTLLLLTASVFLGVTNTSRWRSIRWPRFVIQDIHRNVALLTMIFLGIHIVTSIVDPFAHLQITDAIIPFTSTYRGLWLGLGVVSMELLVAIVATSLSRHWIGFLGWRAIHWLTYLSWPVAIFHGLGTGTDSRAWWSVAMYGICVLAVAIAVLWRVTVGWPSFATIRVAGAATTVIVVVGITVFTVVGPMRSGWAKTAGTPADLLTAADGATPVGTASPSTAALPAGLRDAITGSSNSDGTDVSVVDSSNQGLHFHVAQGSDGTWVLNVSSGGQQVCSSAALIGQGTVTAPCGSVTVTMNLNIDSQNNVTGTVMTR